MSRNVFSFSLLQQLKLSSQHFILIKLVYRCLPLPLYVTIPSVIRLSPTAQTGVVHEHFYLELYVSHLDILYEICCTRTQNFGYPVTSCESVVASRMVSAAVAPTARCLRVLPVSNFDQ
jgi:hypothetical protein